MKDCGSYWAAVATVAASEGWSSNSRAVWKRPASPREGRFRPGRRRQMHQRLLLAPEVEPAVLLGHDLEAEGALVVVGHELHVADLEHHGAHGEFGGKEVLGAGFCGHVHRSGASVATGLR